MSGLSSQEEGFGEAEESDDGSMGDGMSGGKNSTTSVQAMKSNLSVLQFRIRR